MPTSIAVQRVHPARNVRGSITLPGDKSISHRYAMLAGLAHGTTQLHNFSTGADPHSTLSCVRALGAEVSVQDGGEVSITGTGGTFKQPDEPLDCGNSGSTMRMLAGLIAAHPHSFKLIGDASLTARPMERIRAPLSRFFGAAGGSIELTDGHAPIQISGGPLTAIEFSTPIASAQVKTAVLFAGLQASGTTWLSEAVRTRDHTEHALRAFGATLSRDAARLGIAGGQQLYAIDATVPGDLSSAAFFLAAALLFPESQIVLDAVGLNPTRAALLDVITALGGRVRMLMVEEHFGELVGTLQVNGNGNPHTSAQPFEIAGALTAQLIDEIPVLAAVAPYTPCGLHIRDAGELRVKESDRIDLVCRNLRAMGAEVVEYPDGMAIRGRQSLRGGEIDSGGDHRIAMAFAIAALRADGPSEISGAEAAAVSFPEFFSYVDDLAQR